MPGRSPDSPPSSPSPRRSDEPSASLSRRASIVASAFGAGVLVGALFFAAASVYLGSVADAADAAFAAGMLFFGFGLLGWSGSVLAGTGFEEMQRRLDTGSDWTEADSRRAMARIGGFGAGTMAAAMTLGTLLGV
jgi:hypothetical protein